MQLAHLAICLSAEHVLALFHILLCFLHILSSSNFLQCCSLILLVPLLQLLFSSIKTDSHCCLSDHRTSHTSLPGLHPACSSRARLMQVASLPRVCRWGLAPSPRVRHAALAQDVDMLPRMTHLLLGSQWWVGKCRFSEIVAFVMLS